MLLMVPAAYHDAMSDYTAVVSNPIHIILQNVVLSPILYEIFVF